MIPLENTRPWRIVEPSEIQTFCEEFSIQDKVDFAERLLLMNLKIYRHHREMFRDEIPTHKAARNQAKAIAKKSKAIRAAMLNFNAISEPLARINLQEPEIRNVKACTASMIENGFLREEFDGTFLMNLQSIVDTLAVLEANAQRYARFLTEHIDKGESKRPMQDQARVVLTSNVFDLWKTERKTDVTCQFSDTDDQGRQRLVPKNGATKFCVALIQIIDPQLPIDTIRSLMKAEVKRRLDRKRNPPKTVKFKLKSQE